MSDIIYFDHAASSWPKPPQVIEEMIKAVEQYGANPGRGSHQMAVQASRIIFDTRRQLAKLFQINNENSLFFAPNASFALNQAIKGFLQPGDHVVTTMIEHNSVRRPLEYLKRTRSIEVTYLPVKKDGSICLDDLRAALKNNTRLFVCSHSSNLLGSIIPIADISEIVKKSGIKLLVDAAQTAGNYPIDVNAMGIDMLAFPGHKGLLGPQGTGGLYIHPDIELDPLLHGGTGSQSEDIDQPNVLPDRYETGTLNTPGIAGLNAGVKFVLEQGVSVIQKKEWDLTQRLMEGLLHIEGVSLLGPALGEEKTGIVSFNISGRDASEIAFLLDRQYRIAVRAGYHCTPLAHETAETRSTGAVRASIGYYTTEEEVDYFISSIKEIARLDS